MATSPVSAQALRDARSSLRLGERRPSVPLDLADLEKVKSRLAQRELSISHQGWLTKLSRGGLPNWNRRWFILIGGSLYYSRSDAPTDRDLHVFSELMHAQEVVLAPPQAGYSFVFKLRVESETLVFAAPSNEARLNWLGVLEQALGMQPVGAGILHAELRREAETSDALRLRIVSTELADKEAAMQACVAREEALRHEVATLRHALRCKDEQLWQLAATLTAHNVAMPTMGAAAPPAAPPREALWAAPLPEDVAAGSSLLEAAQASVAGPPAADSTVPLESDHGVTVGDLRDGGWACPTGGQASTTPSGSQTAREMSVPQREAAAGRVSRRTIVGAAASLLRTVNSARAPTETSPASSLHCSPHVNRRKPRRWSEPSVATSATVINLSSAAPAHLSLSSAALADHTKLTAARSQRSLSLSHGRPDADVPSGGDHGPSGLAAGVPTASPSDSSVPFSPLIKQGMLTKLSKGGFTANWNRRAFVLIGSSLFYAKDRTTLTAQPKRSVVARCTHGTTRPPATATCWPCRCAADRTARATTRSAKGRSCCCSLRTHRVTSTRGSMRSHAEHACRSVRWTTLRRRLRCSCTAVAPMARCRGCCKLSPTPAVLWVAARARKSGVPTSTEARRTASTPSCYRQCLARAPCRQTTSGGTPRNGGGCPRSFATSDECVRERRPAG